MLLCPAVRGVRGPALQPPVRGSGRPVPGPGPGAGSAWAWLTLGRPGGAVPERGQGRPKLDFRLFYAILGDRSSPACPSSWPSPTSLRAKASTPRRWWPSWRRAWATGTWRPGIRGLHGWPRLREACRSAGLQPLLGCRFTWRGMGFGALPHSNRGYAELCRLLTDQAHGREGDPPQDCALLAETLEGQEDPGPGGLRPPPSWPTGATRARRPGPWSGACRWRRPRCCASAGRPGWNCTG